MKTITQSLKTIALALILSLGVSYVSAWTVPTVAPTGGNTASPLNTSTNTQYKGGPLGIGGLLRSYSNLIVDGDVGIGTTAPAAKLEISGSILQQNTNILQAKNSSGTAETWMWPRWSDNIMYTNFGSAGWAIRNNSSSPVMFLNPSGDVGIGTMAPGAKLDITGTNGFGIKYIKTGSKDARISVGDPVKTWSIASGWATAGDFSIIEEGVSGDRLYIRQGGEVGIGTTNPLNKLDIATAPVRSDVGVSLNGKTALTASTADTWLRLNQNSQFTNGVYTPGKMTADGGFSTTWTVAPPTNGIYSAGDIKAVGHVTGTFGAVWTMGAGYFSGTYYRDSSCTTGAPGGVGSADNIWNNGALDQTSAYCKATLPVCYNYDGSGNCLNYYYRCDNNDYSSAPVSYISGTCIGSGRDSYGCVSGSGSVNVGSGFQACVWF